MFNEDSSVTRPPCPLEGLLKGSDPFLKDQNPCPLCPVKGSDPVKKDQNLLYPLSTL